jgi:hypothetical protein
MTFVFIVSVGSVLLKKLKKLNTQTCKITVFLIQILHLLLLNISTVTKFVIQSANLFFTSQAFIREI